MQSSDSPDEPETSARGAARRIRPCHYCRKRRIACDRIDNSSTEACRRCQAKGLACEYDDPVHPVAPLAERESNYDAAMRVQIQRLESMLERLERQAGLAAAPAEPAAALQVSIDDVVASMSSMVLRTKGVKPTDDPDELVREVKQALDEDEAATLELTKVGFVLNQAHKTVDASLEQMVGLLPPWEETRLIVLKVFPGLWIAHRNALMSPAFPLRAERVYQEQSPLPEALAEVYAVLAVTYSCLAVRHGDQSDEYRRFQRLADDHIANTKRSLELANYIETPSMLSIRAVHLITIAMICCAKETRMFDRALALLPLAVAGVYRLGLDQEHPDTLSKETPMETYERRGLVNSVMREDVYFGLVWQGQITASWARLTCPSAQALRDEDLPPELRDSPYRVGERLFEALRLRVPLAMARREVLQATAKQKTVDYEKVKELAMKIDGIERRMPEEWHLQPGEPTPVINDMASRTQRFLTMPAVWQLRILLHRVFIGYRKPSAGLSEEEVRWHRDETLKASWQLLTVLREDVYVVCGPYVAFTYTCFDAVIAALMVLALEPEHSLATEVKRLCVHYVNLCGLPEAPRFMNRLARLLQLLLDKPKARLSDEQTGAKRPKHGISDIVDHRSAMFSHTGAPSTATPFDFAVPHVGPVMPAPEADYEDELPHLIPQPLPGSSFSEDLDLLEGLDAATGSTFSPTFDFSLPFMLQTPFSGSDPP